MTNRRKIFVGLALALTTLTACGDDDDGGGRKIISADTYHYTVDEVRDSTDVYRCITNRSTGGMWCENIGLGGNG